MNTTKSAWDYTAFDDGFLPDDLPDPATFLPPCNASLITNCTNTTGLRGHHSPNDDDNSGVWSSFLFVMFLLNVCLRGSRIPEPHHRAALIARERRLEEEAREKIKADPKRRQRFMDANLITKKVISCDANNKALRLGELDGSVTLDDSTVNSLEDENSSECVICFDTFRKGDHVTWARSMECLHVFHQECIETWLQDPKHDDCPSCRCQIIHDDGEEEEQLPAIEDGRRSSSLAYVIMDGLISQVRRARNSLSGSSLRVETMDSSQRSRGSFNLRRVLSAGVAEGDERRPSAIGRTFRRVSSGIYSRLSGLDDKPEEGTAATLKQPFDMRRTQSEGGPRTPTIRNSSRDLERSDSTIDEDLVLDLELGECSNEARRPGLLRLAFKRNSGVYSKLQDNSESGFRSLVSEISDDEDSLEPRSLWREGDDEDFDIEAGESKTSST